MILDKSDEELIEIIKNSHTAKETFERIGCSGTAYQRNVIRELMEEHNLEYKKVIIPDRFPPDHIVLNAIKNSHTIGGVVAMAFNYPAHKHSQHVHLIMRKYGVKFGKEKPPPNRFRPTDEALRESIAKSYYIKEVVADCYPNYRNEHSKVIQQFMYDNGLSLLHDPNKGKSGPKIGRKERPILFDPKDEDIQALAW